MSQEAHKIFIRPREAEEVSVLPRCLMYQLVCCITPTRNSIPQALEMMIRVVHTVSGEDSNRYCEGRRVFGGVQIQRHLID